MTYQFPLGGPLNVADLIATMGQLTINGVPMIGPAWAVLDLRPLWGPADMRGSDRLLPGVTGVIPYRRRATVSKRDLDMAITGYVDRTGAPQSQPFIGLQNNFDYLRSHVVDPTNIGDGTRAAVLTMPDGSTRTGNVHVVALIPGNQRRPLSLSTLSIEIPNGVLV